MLHALILAIITLFYVFPSKKIVSREPKDTTLQANITAVVHHYIVYSWNKGQISSKA